MNRRIPVKKNYFSFLSDLSGSRIVPIGFYMTAGMTVILLSWFVFNSIEMDASTIFGELVLLVIPIAVIAVIFVGFEKITGISCLLGVEWVGKNTLLLFDWVFLNIQKLRGIDPKTNNHHVAQSDAVLSGSNQFKEQISETDILKTNTDELTLDFEAIDAEDPLLEPSAYKQDIFMETPVAELESIVNIPDKREILEKNDIATSTDWTAENETPKTDTEEPTLDFDAIDAKDPLLDSFTYKQQLFTDTQKVGIEPTANVPLELPAIDQGHSALPANSLSDQVDEQSFINSDSMELIDIQSDVTKETKLASAEPEPEPEIDDVERELKSLLHEKQDRVDDELVTEPENSLLMDEGDFRETAGSEHKEPEDGLSFSIKSLFEEVENKVFDSENAVDNIGKAPEVPEININQSINSTEPENRVIADSENTSSTPSMLFQAEQTAANILSSFSEKFSRSSEKLSQSFIYHKEPEHHLPSIELLQAHQKAVNSYSTVELDEMSRSIERVLKDYKVLAEVAGAYPGPIITRFELALAPGVKVSRVSGLAKDLARAMLVTSVRVVEIIEGTPYIGLEIPNQERELVSFREIISSEVFQQSVSPLTLALGKDVSGQTVVSDLAKMPHLLVAGTTGSGKSVAINTMILSMLYKATPDQVRMIMVDPKMLELSIYEGIPHLLTPVVTDMKEAQNALRWAVAEMERRYKLMSKVGVRNLAGFNQKIEEATARGETIRDPLFQLIDPLEEGETFPVLSTLPSIVIVIDELADMMMIVGKKVEELIARLAQKARAAGIHLILATQRPSVDVLTGLIKANVPTRISFQVSSRIDSRTILDQGGAEALLGNGDMLFLPSGTSVPTRSHGAFVDDDEVHAVVDYLKTQGGANYLTEITQEAPVENPANTEAVQDEVDDLYEDAVSFVMETGRASISSVQRRFKVGYNRAARMIDQMEEENIVSEPEGNGSRRVLNREG